MWDRRRSDGVRAQFGHVRIGLGEERARTKFGAVELGALADQEPACAQMMVDLMAEQSYVRDIPRAISLGEYPGWFCTGDQEAARAAVRGIIMHAAFFHAPRDVGVAVITTEDRAPRWDWCKWLPHHKDEAGRTMTFTSAAELVAQLGEAYSSRGKFAADAVRTTSMAAAGDMTSGRPGAPAGTRLLIVVTDADDVDWSVLLPEDGRDTGVEGVCFVALGEDVEGPLRTPSRTLVFEGERVLRAETDADDPTLLARPDQVPGWAAEAFARRMAAWRRGSRASALLGGAVEAPKLRLGQLIGIEDWANFDPSQTWLWARNRRNILRVPTGQFIDSGRPWYLDIKDGFHGSHFGLGGSTGSGKSEFLRVHAVALFATHSPQDLVIFPADFKGKVTFRGFEELPHVPHVLNNLESSPDSIQRFIQVMMGELERRQRMLDYAGELAAGLIMRVPSNIAEYRALRAKRPDLDLPAMPYLYMPFDELMQAKRSFPELLAIIRIACTTGRALGVHVGPVSQVLDDSLMAGIGTHLRGRIALRMNDPKDYRPVLGTSSPGSLPNRKGVGYFAADLGSPAQRIQVAYISGTYIAPSSAGPVGAAAAPVGETIGGVRLITGVKTPAAAAVERLFGQTDRPADPIAVDPAGELDETIEEAARSVGGEDDDDEDHEEDEEDISSTDMGMAIAVLKSHGGQIDHNPWLPELETHRPVWDAVAEFVRSRRPELAAGLLDWDAGHPGRYVSELVPHLGAGPLTPVAACGVVDKPRDHAQDVLIVDLAHNTALAGAPDSRKSTALTSIVMSAATLYSPERVTFFCLDLGGGGLGWLQDLHHVGAVIAGDGDQYGIGRMVNHVHHIMRGRAAQWAAARINTVDEWRRARFGGDPVAAAAVPDDGYGDVYLVIDGFDKFLASFAEHQDAIAAIARSGPDFGIHLLVALNSWNARGTFALWDQFKSRYELRLDNPGDSLMGNMPAQTIPQFPGRGMITVSGATRARRGVVQVQGADAVPPEPTTWHTLYGAPEVVTPAGERIRLGTDTAAVVAATINGLYPSSRPAERMPELPAVIGLADIPRPPRAVAGQLVLGIAETDAGPYLWSPAEDVHLAVMGSTRAGRSTVLRLIGQQLQRRIETAAPGQAPLVFVFDQAEALAGAVMDAAQYVYLPSQITPAVDQIKALLAARDTGEVLTQAELAARRATGARSYAGPEVFVLIDNLTDFVQPVDPFAWNDLIEKGKLLGFHVIVSRVADASLIGEWPGRGMLASMKRSGTPVMLMSSPPELVNLVSNLRGQVLPPGRATMVTRAGRAMIQVAMPDAELPGPGGEQTSARQLR